jgi:hypothetical protein
VLRVKCELRTSVNEGRHHDVHAFSCTYSKYRYVLTGSDYAAYGYLIMKIPFHLASIVKTGPKEDTMT